MQKSNLKLKIFFLAIIFCGVFGVAKNSQAATYYVDYSNGSDTNNGTLTSTAFKHCPGDSNATGNANRLLSAGDNVILKGGVIYIGSISINASGSGGSPIVYDGNSAGSWGSGRAIINCDDTYYQGFNFTDARSYVTIKNFEITGTKAYDWDLPVYYSSGILNRYGGDHIILRDNYIHEIGYWENDNDYCQMESDHYKYGGGTGIYLNEVTDSLADNNTIIKVGGTGIECQMCANDTLSNNTIGDHLVWGIDISSGSDGSCISPHGIMISGNEIYDLYHMDNPGDTYLGDPDYWHGTPNLGAGCWGPHTDFIFIRGTGNETCTPYDVTVENNLFYNNKTFPSDAYGGTSFVYTATSPIGASKFRNNVGINCFSIRPFDLSGTWEVYNNTLYTLNGNYGFTVRGNTSKFYNNLVVTNDNLIEYENATDLAGLLFDNNLYYSASPYFRQDSPVNGYTFNQWKALASHPDSHSIAPVSTAAIQFVDTTGYPTDCKSMDLRLQLGSPAVNAGADLTSVWTGAIDINGISRPQGSAWDIGAYEYAGSDTTPPAAPQGLSVE